MSDAGFAQSEESMNALSEGLLSGRRGRHLSFEAALARALGSTAHPRSAGMKERYRVVWDALRAESMERFIKHVEGEEFLFRVREALTDLRKDTSLRPTCFTITESARLLRTTVKEVRWLVKSAQLSVCWVGDQQLIPNSEIERHLRETVPAPKKAKRALGRAGAGRGGSDL